MFSQCKYQWCSSRIVTCVLSKNVLTIDCNYFNNEYNKTKINIR